MRDELGEIIEKRIVFERYELWAQAGLNAARVLVGSYDRRDVAQAAGDVLADNNKGVDHYFVGIDYIALSNVGRDEYFWVRVIDSGKWVRLGVEALAYDAEDAERQKRVAARKQLAREDEVARSRANR